jgi:hypothetical protein
LTFRDVWNLEIEKASQEATTRAEHPLRSVRPNA